MTRAPIIRARFEGELVVDSFAGGGGASTGIEQAIGRPVDIAINHSAEAIAMHKANHPETKHFLEDVWAVDPRAACSGRPVGLAWFSPDCTHFSRAKGTKPLKQEIRGLAWVVVRWAREVQPRVIVVENVEEFMTWGPLGPDGRPRADGIGRTFREWLAALRNLGYAVDFRTLVAADYGAPTTRKRLFLVARRDGAGIAWPEPTHGKGRPNAWRPAAEVIDWSLPCPSIFLSKRQARAFGVKRPLARATQRRIAAGIERYVLRSASPFILPLTHGADRSRGLDVPAPTITGAHRGECALCAHALINTRNGERKGQAPRIRDPQQPYPTVTATGSQGALVAAFLAKHYGGHTTPGTDCARPMDTVTAKDHHAIVAAWLTKFYGSARAGADVRDPMPTVTSGGGRGGGHLAEVRAFLVQYNGASSALQVGLPLGTVTTRDRFGLVTIEGEDYEIADIGMRILQPRELFSAQDFPVDYFIDAWVNGKPLTKTAQTKLAGNAVPPAFPRAIVAENARAA